MFNFVYQSSYCKYKKSWSEQESEYGSFVMRSEDKRKPGIRKHDLV